MVELALAVEVVALSDICNVLSEFRTPSKDNSYKPYFASGSEGIWQWAKSILVILRHLCNRNLRCRIHRAGMLIVASTPLPMTTACPN